MVLCEISPTLCRILEAKGYGGRLVEGDFLERFSLLDPKDGQGEVLGRDAAIRPRADEPAV